MCKIACFDQFNEDRHRCFGIRVGDIVRIYCKDYYDFTTEVLGVESFASNNEIWVIWKDGTIRKYFAEYCDLITKVEDRDKNSVHCLELIINKAFKKLIDTPNWYKSDEFNLYNFSWIQRRIIIPYKEGNCLIERMVHFLALSKMQVTDPKDIVHVIV